MALIQTATQTIQTASAELAHRSKSQEHCVGQGRAQKDAPRGPLDALRPSPSELPAATQGDSFAGTGSVQHSHPSTDPHDLRWKSLHEATWEQVLQNYQSCNLWPGRYPGYTVYSKSGTIDSPAPSRAPSPMTSSTLLPTPSSTPEPTPSPTPSPSPSQRTVFAAPQWPCMRV